MPQSSVLQEYFRDLAAGIGNLVHGAFDLVCLVALGLVIYASGIDAANAGFQGRVMFGVQASITGGSGIAVKASHAPTSCGLTNDLLASAHRTCIQAFVLEPTGI